MTMKNYFKFLVVTIGILAILLTPFVGVSCSSSTGDSDSSNGGNGGGSSNMPKLLFVSTRSDPDGVYGDLYVGDANFTYGTLDNVERITTDENQGIYNDPFIAQSADRVLCAMTQGSMLYNDIRSVDFDSGEMETLTDSTERNNLHPLVTSDNRIVYSSYIRDSGTQQIRIMDLDGSNDELVFEPSGQVESMGINSSGKVIVFTMVDSNQQTDIYTYKLESGDLDQLTDTPSESEFAANFTPEGLILFLAEGDVEGNFDIYAMESDGSNESKLTNGEIAYNGPLWKYYRWIVFQSGDDLYYHDLSTGQNIQVTGKGEEDEGVNYSHSLYEEE